MDRSIFSNLNKTWIFDLDGTLVIHNGYKCGEDTLLPGIKEFFDETLLILTMFLLLLQDIVSSKVLLKSASWRMESNMIKSYMICQMGKEYL